MADDLFDIVFKGELVRTVDLATAKKNVGQLFKISGAKLEALFSGRTVVLKRNLTFEVASKYRVAIKKAGARVDVVPQKAPEAKPKEAPETSPPPVAARPPVSRGKAVFGEQVSASRVQEPAPARAADAVGQVNEASFEDSQQAGAFSLAPPGADMVLPSERVHETPVVVDVSSLSCAPVGSDLVQPSERVHEAPVVVDISDISLKEMAGNLLDKSEQRHFEARNVDTSGIDVAPVGADVLTDSERPKVTPVQVDISALSVAEQGPRLSPERPKAPPPPDVSGITLVSE